MLGVLNALLRDGLTLQQIHGRPIGRRTGGHPFASTAGVFLAPAHLPFRLMGEEGGEYHRVPGRRQASSLLPLTHFPESFL